MTVGRRWRTLVAISLIVLVTLAWLSLSTYRRSVIRAKEKTLVSHLHAMRDALDKYRAENGRCPESLRSLEEHRYISTVPTDPFTNSKDTWRYAQGDCDVKSTSNARADDGRRYAEW
jgi:general secretion pathway protein G